MLGIIEHYASLVANLDCAVGFWREIQESHTSGARFFLCVFYVVATSRRGLCFARSQVPSQRFHPVSYHLVYVFLSDYILRSIFLGKVRSRKGILDGWRHYLGDYFVYGFYRQIDVMTPKSLQPTPGGGPGSLRSCGLFCVADPACSAVAGYNR